MKMIKNIKFWMASLVLLGIGVTSCIEEGKDDISGKGTDEFRFDKGEFGVVTFKPNLAGQTSEFITIYRDAVSTATMDKSVTVSFLISEDSLDAYNLEHETEYIAADPSWYELSIPEGSLTFAPNEGAKTIHITLDTNPFDLSKQYVIPMVINNASAGYALNEGHNLSIVQTLPINQYDGVYSYGGSVGRYDGTTGAPANDGLDGAIVDGVEVDLGTTGANSVNFSPTW